MAARRSLLLHAVIAVVLLIVFVAAALAGVAGLGLAGLWLWGYVGAIEVQGFVTVLGGGACLTAAIVIAWSIVPRPDRFEPPGPEVTAADQPALFAELRAVAAATGEAM